MNFYISPCPNDTFIYEEMTRKSEFRFHYYDIDELNRLALQETRGVLKISAALWPAVKHNYYLLNCGGAMGYGCGPLLLSSSGLSEFDPADNIWIPGEQTTAALLFKYWFAREYSSLWPKLESLRFDRLYAGLKSGTLKQGVVIHESRFIWQQDGLNLIKDLGEYWEQSQGLPIPLGIVILHRSLGDAQKISMEKEIRLSLEKALSRGDTITPLIREKADIADEEVIRRHIRTFVNDFSYDINEQGLRALQQLENVAL